MASFAEGRNWRRQAGPVPQPLSKRERALQPHLPSSFRPRTELWDQKPPVGGRPLHTLVPTCPHLPPYPPTESP